LVGWRSGPTTTQGITRSLLKHGQVAKVSFLARSHYRFELLFDALKAIVVVLVLTAIWKEIYSARDAIAGFSRRQIIVYTCAASTLALLFNVDLSHYLSRKISTGAIALDLLKPVEINALYLSENLGGALYGGIFVAIPTLVALSCLFGLSEILTMNWLAVIPLALLGFFVHYLFCYLLALTTFFTVEAWGIEYLRVNLIRFFAGAFLPVSFFPVVLQRVSDVLPFKYMIFPAAAAASGNLPHDSVGTTMLAPLGWIVILSAADLALWSWVSRKVTVHGG